MASIDKIISYAKEVLGKDRTGHDFDHVSRVAKLALKINEEEQLSGDSFVIAAAAYLHDTIDDKIVSDTKQAKSAVEQLLIDAGAISEQRKQIQHIMENMSFSAELLQGAVVESIEGKLVQDADRLDALGAIGIFRTSYYGGAHQSILYDPTQKPKIYADHADYRKGTTVVNHFYEKLFLLPDKMHTAYGKKEAIRRRQFMVDFLDEFYHEWRSELH